MTYSSQHVAAITARTAWLKTARPSQIPAFDTNSIWLALAGRGFGKSRCMYEDGWWNAVIHPGSRSCVVTPTQDDLRKVTFDGKSGFRALVPPEILMGGSFSTGYNKVEKLLTFWNGSTIQGYSSEACERLRGPEHQFAMCEEMAAWKNMRYTWDMLVFGMRIGDNPRTTIATTPRPVPLIRELSKSNKVKVIRGSTFENEANLSNAVLDALRERYDGTNLGRQELYGELIDDVEGALWNRAMLDLAVVREVPQMQRLVVAVDPSGTAGEDDSGDSIGIVVAGKGVDGLCYILADRTCKLSPDGWGRMAVNAYNEFKADRLVAERNFGGAMVKSIIQTIDRNVSYKEVTASRGKIARAEPVAALYEQGKVKHVLGLGKLEDQMCEMTTDGYVGSGSPDRVDALVWAVTDLMLGSQGGVTFID